MKLNKFYNIGSTRWRAKNWGRGGVEQHCGKDDEKKKAILYIACKQTCEEKWVFVTDPWI